MPASVLSRLRPQGNNYFLSLHKAKEENHGFWILLAESSDLKDITSLLWVLDSIFDWRKKIKVRTIILIYWQFYKDWKKWDPQMGLSSLQSFLHFFFLPVFSAKSPTVTICSESGQCKSGFLLLSTADIKTPSYTAVGAALYLVGCLVAFPFSANLVPVTAPSTQRGQPQMSPDLTQIPLDHGKDSPPDENHWYNKQT